jgi:pentatricopeptide repeat protein
MGRYVGHAATFVQVRAMTEEKDGFDAWLDCKPMQKMDEQKVNSRNSQGKPAPRNSKCMAAQIDGQYMPADVRWTYGAIVKAYVNAGNVQAVRRWLSEMSEAGFKPSRDFYEELLQMCLRRNLKDLASEVSILMVKNCDPRSTPNRENRPPSTHSSRGGISMVDIYDKLNTLAQGNGQVDIPRKGMELTRIPTPPGLEPPPGLQTPPGLELPEMQIEHISL